MVKENNLNEDATFKMGLNEFADRLPTEKLSSINIKGTEF